MNVNFNFNLKNFILLKVKKRSYKLLIASTVCHFIGIFLSIGGIMVVNAMALAIFNTSCVDKCITSLHEYFCLVMIVLGVLGCAVCVLYVGIIEYAIFREARKLDMYLVSS